MCKYCDENAEAYKILASKRKEIFPYFDSYQKEYAYFLTNLLEKYIEGNMIDTILDLGCGTGEILIYIYDKINEKYRDKELKYIGVNYCETEIEIAKKLVGQNRKINIIRTKFDDIHTSKDIPLLNKAAVLCLGHTITHFLNVDDIITFLKSKRPLVFIHDLNKEWDDLLTKIGNGDIVETIRKPLNVKYNNGHDVILYNLLTTGIIVRRKKYVNRGIEELILKADKLERNLLFFTYQMKITSNEIIQNIKNSSYLLIEKYQYVSGYGPMIGYKYESISEYAKKINDIYYKVISSFIDSILSDESILKIFNNSSTCIISAIILPFDPIHTFAKYYEKNIRYQQITKELMIISEPNVLQDRYPHTPGLYNTLLGPVSSIYAIPLGAIRNIDRTKVDEYFYELEKQYYKRKMPNEFKTDEKIFTILPFYYGSLPLFCLLLSCSDQNVQANYINLQHYYMGYNEIKDKYLTDESIQAKIITPMIQELKRNHIGLEIFNEYLNYALNKKWKSWIICFPTECINDDCIIREKNKRIIETFIKSYSITPAQQITEYLSKKLADVGFFKGDDHEMLTDNHKSKIQIIKNRLNRNYRNSANEEINNIIKWFEDKINKFNDCQDYEDVEIIREFKNFKTVFCRAGSNEKEIYRFSTWRLVLLIHILTGLSMKGHNKKIKYVLNRREYEELSLIEKPAEFVAEEDLTFDIATLINRFKKIGQSQNINIKCININERHGYSQKIKDITKCTITVEFNNKIIIGYNEPGYTYGQDYEDLIKLINKFYKVESTIKFKKAIFNYEYQERSNNCYSFIKNNGRFISIKFK